MFSEEKTLCGVDFVKKFNDRVWLKVSYDDHLEEHRLNVSTPMAFLVIILFVYMSHF